jgi:mono/diheme cytochrome c family protein
MKMNHRFTSKVCRSFGAVILTVVLLTPLSAAAQADSGRTQSAKEIYMSACAACHGADGKGQSQSRVGFDTPIPDFTDCNFATREPNADWVAVAHQGGPTRGFAQLMPAFGEALSMEELEKAVEYTRTFCPDNNWPRGALNLPRAMITEKAYPEDEAVLTLGAGENFESISGEFVYEQRFGSRNQFEISVPFGWNEMMVPGGNGPVSNWSSGLGDVAVGIKRAFFHSLKSGYIFSGAAELILPTGDRAEGLGKDTFIFEPFFSYGQILPSDFFLHSQLGFEFPFQTSKAENEAFLRLAMGRSFTTGGFWGRAWSPIVEVLASKELVSSEDIVWDVVPQIQVSLNTRQHILLNVGVRIPLTGTENRDFQIMTYILWDWFDGNLFEGW